jgi:hypothetical protein
MTVDKITADKMTVDKMTADKMTADKMTCCLHSKYFLNYFLKVGERITCMVLFYHFCSEET